ncbi:MAG: hypothetical protein JW984_03890 [Deltaproteobacteria bacterium]|uniref:Uncharacterized protein n=1 Tax=Candidatus Zymogenus saltonus TaxID=2844893 RepID=A0A9D8KCS3_9DELT|nr:hypothetical protein [Candidatus Zymogenus saltonus]
MNTVLTYYVLGLVAATAVGVILTLLLLRNIEEVLSFTSIPVNPKRLSTLIKLFAIAAVLVGGISRKFYGCNYKYESLVGNPTALNFKVMGQIEGALYYLMIYLIIVFALYLTAYILKRVGSKNV